MKIAQLSLVRRAYAVMIEDVAQARRLIDWAGKCADCTDGFPADYRLAIVGLSARIARCEELATKGKWPPKPLEPADTKTLYRRTYGRAPAAYTPAQRRAYSKRK